jgi:branched-chain amino acid transport system permease protein
MHWSELIIQQTINGVTRGALFALIALGYTMVYGIIELINFAHGDIFMLGLMVSLTLFTALGLAYTLQGWELVIFLPLIRVFTMLCHWVPQPRSGSSPIGRCGVLRGLFL